MDDAMQLETKTATKSNLPFLIFFGAYTAGSVFLLLLGASSALAGIFPRLYDTFQGWSQTTDLLGLLSRAIALGSRISLGPLQIGMDYTLSLVNLGVGILIVARRPWDWVTRLLGLGMVGAAMAFNFQTHTDLAAISQYVPSLRPLYIYHFILHAVSGATYIHALLLFPNGKLVPRKLLILLVVIYLLMIEEIAFPFLKSIFGTALFLQPNIVASAQSPLEAILYRWLSASGAGLLMSIMSYAFAVRSPVDSFDTIIHAESAFFILLYGLLIPIVGAGSQIYRYRRVSTPQEREQTKLVVWALALGFAATLFFFVLSLIDTLTKAEFDFQSLEHLEQSSSWIFPPLFAFVPLSMFVAIRRSRLFDIDLVISRTLLYGSLTAILAGGFAGLNNILQRMFLALTGATSEAAIVIAALISAAAFTPIRSYLQKIIDRRFKEPIDRKARQETEPSPRLLVSQPNVNENLRGFLETVVRSFDAESGAVFLGTGDSAELVHTMGEWNGESALRIPLESQGVQLGHIALGARRNGLEYTTFDQASLKQAADLFAHAIGVVWTKE
jgi:hypothetical protein